MEAPTTMRAVRGSINFANFSWKFFPPSTNISHPLIRFTRKDTMFSLGTADLNAFDELKKPFEQKYAGSLPPRSP
jgi:hypothetical protein